MMGSELKETTVQPDASGAPAAQDNQTAAPPAAPATVLVRLDMAEARATMAELDAAAALRTELARSLLTLRDALDKLRLACGLAMNAPSQDVIRAHETRLRAELEHIEATAVAHLAPVAGADPK
jgi:hypothetical protein